jgi:hypothetical protein
MREVTHEYFVTDGQLISKELYEQDKEFFIYVGYSDHEGKATKAELYFDRDTVKPVIIDHDLAYDPASNIVSFKRTRDYSVSTQVASAIPNVLR